MEQSVATTIPNICSPARKFGKNVNEFVIVIVSSYKAHTPDKIKRHTSPTPPSYQPSSRIRTSSPKSKPMSTQKALFIDTKLGPFTLHTDHPIPKPGHGQLLVRIEAAALNPVDWKIQKLGWFVDKYPVLIGTDIAGVVQEVGEGASKGFAKGDRVVFQGAWSGDMAGYQQYALTNAVTTAKIPSHISFDEASTLPVACAAAVAGFYLAPPSGAGLIPPFNEAGRGKYKGKPAVILGGATSVGQF
ncbi:hypothetical protein H0H93_007860, partial [Arthromyces matolae]